MWRLRVSSFIFLDAMGHITQISGFVTSLQPISILAQTAHDNHDGAIELAVAKWCGKIFDIDNVHEGSQTLPDSVPEYVSPVLCSLLYDP